MAFCPEDIMISETTVTPKATTFKNVQSLQRTAAIAKVRLPLLT